MQYGNTEKLGSKQFTVSVCSWCLQHNWQSLHILRRQHVMAVTAFLNA